MAHPICWTSFRPLVRSDFDWGGNGLSTARPNEIRPWGKHSLTQFLSLEVPFRKLMAKLRELMWFSILISHRHLLSSVWEILVFISSFWFCSLLTFGSIEFLNPSMLDRDLIDFCTDRATHRITASCQWMTSWASPPSCWRAATRTAKSSCASATTWTWSMTAPSSMRTRPPSP